MRNTSFFQLILASLFVAASPSVYAQEPMKIAACEQLFVKNNLLLLAEQYNIDIAKAGVVQAKIWDLPYLSGEFNAVNPQDGRVFDIGNSGQKAIAVQQLIYLGKKKKNEVDFAKSAIGIAELQLEQLLRNLRYQLRQSFYTIYFEQQKGRSIGNQISQIDTLVRAYSVQTQKGNLPLRDLVRLQSLSLDLKNDFLATQKTINSQQETLKIILGSTANIVPLAENTQLATYYTKNSLPSVDSLLQLALLKNPDYLSFQKIIASNELLVKWQESLNTPDVTAGISYDQRGGAFNNQVNFTFGIPLPLWNKNKGNIQVAKARLEQTKTLQAQKVREIRTKVENAYQTWQQQHTQYLQIAANGTTNFDLVYRGILDNFQKHNVSLLEFTDFMESYNNSTLQFNEMQKQLVLSCEDLNFIVNEQLF